MSQELGTGGKGTPVQPAYLAPTAPFVLSLIAGLLILAGAGMMMTFSYGTPYYGMMGGYYGTANGYYGMMGGWFYGAGVVGLIAGIVVLIGAAMIYVRPRSASTWGLLVLIFSIVSFFGMGGFLIGAILGIIGGVLAMTWKPGAAPA